MGHYYSEMACGTCGRIPCSCVKQADMTHAMWLVDANDLEVMQVAQFDRKHKYTKASNGMLFPGNPYALRFSSKLWPTKEEAMAHRVNVIDSQISRAKQDLHEQNVRLQTLIMKRDQLNEQS